MLLVADILLLVAVFWTIMSGVEYFVGALPLFRPERLARPLEKGHA
jgi:CDP-diacylglycerol--glycerol-3-phosphate 3-phosphatidyltransferase